MRILLALTPVIAPTAYLPGAVDLPAPSAPPAPLVAAAPPTLTSVVPLSAPVPTALSKTLTAASQPSALAALQATASRPEAKAKAEATAAFDASLFFDGARLGREGEPVYPKLMSTDSASLRLPIQSAILRSIVDELQADLEESVVRGEWFGPRTTVDGPACGDAAPKLAALLRERGVPARLVEAEFHYYVVVDTPDGWIVVDPTIRQFFGRATAPKSVPKVFIGSLGELRAFFDRHGSHKSTRYGVERLYLSQARDREAQVTAMILALRTDRSRDLEPLRRALGLPPL